MGPLLRLAWIGTIVAMLGCGDSPSRDLSVVSEDSRLAAAAAGLLDQVLARSGMPLERPVRVERRSREQLEAYLRHKLDQELSPEEARHIVAAYGLLGLVEEDLDLRDLLLSVYMEQVVGFYDPDSTALFVIQGQPVADLESVLVHELVHAVQDQTAPLDSITDRSRGNDRQIAAQAAIEGHATLVMLEAVMGQGDGDGMDLASLPDFATTLRPMLESVRSQYPELARAPRIIQEELLFPYVEGAAYVQRRWLEAGARVAPFGDLLPQSTEQILDPGRGPGPTADAPTEVRLEARGTPFVYSNSLGQMETAVLLEEWLGGDGEGAAGGWDGDRFALFGSEERGWSLVWVSIWDDPSSRDRFVETATRGLDNAGAGAELEPTEVDGRPAAILRVGSPPAADPILEPGA